MVSPEERIVAADLVGAIAKAGVNPLLEGRALQDALISAIADRQGYVDWTVDHAGWLVTLCERLASMSAVAVLKRDRNNVA
jgi:hypothetical protein